MRHDSPAGLLKTEARRGGGGGGGGEQATGGGSWALS